MGILTGCDCSCNIRISPGRQRRCLGCQQQGRMVDGCPRSCPEIPRTCRFITFATGRRPAPCPAKPPLVSWTRGGPGNDAGQDVTEACLAVSVRVSSTAVPFPLQKRRHQREWLRKKHLLSGLVPMSTRKHPGCVSGTGTASRTSIPRGPPPSPQSVGLTDLAPQDGRAEARLAALLLRGSAKGWAELRGIEEKIWRKEMNRNSSGTLMARQLIDSGAILLEFSGQAGKAAPFALGLPSHQFLGEDGG